MDDERSEVEELNVVEGEEGIVQELVNYNLPVKDPPPIVSDPLLMGRARVAAYEIIKEKVVRRGKSKITTVNAKVNGKDA